jgi:hypothetical protein
LGLPVAWLVLHLVLFFASAGLLAALPCMPLFIFGRSYYHQFFFLAADHFYVAKVTAHTSLVAVSKTAY